MSAPDVFDQDDAGIVELLQEHVDEAQLGAVREAVEYCPAAALWLSSEA